MKATGSEELDEENNKGLAKIAAHKLRTLISTGKIKPGERLTEAGVTQLLKISRTPAREALQSLSAEGIVLIRPFKGAEVIVHSEKFIDDTIEMIKSLIYTVGHLIITRSTEKDVNEICAVIFEMQASFRRKNRNNYISLKLVLNDKLLESTNNAILKKEYIKLVNLLYTFRYKIEQNDTDWETDLNLAISLGDAIESRDEKTVIDILKKQIVLI